MHFYNSSLAETNDWRGAFSPSIHYLWIEGISGSGIDTQGFWPAFLNVALFQRLIDLRHNSKRNATLKA
jgi:hypothetical protein